MHTALLELVEHFDSPSAVNFFRSTDARAKNSIARVLLESGREWAHDLKEAELVKVIFAAIVIGGETLHKYLKVLVSEDKKRTEIIHKQLKDSLMYELHFNDLYSKWLSENLHRLNQSSVNLLETLDPDSYHNVRVSTITTFAYDKQLALFKMRVKNIYKGF